MTEPSAPRIGVTCTGADGAWTCAVRVSEPSGWTDHEVFISEVDLPPSMAAPPIDEVERLIELTFAYLLEREPKESILRRFDLSVVEQYFPDYPSVIDRRIRR